MDRTQAMPTYKGPVHIFTYNYLFHVSSRNNNMVMLITCYNKQWEKNKGFLKFYNILNFIYLYVIVQNCHIHEIRHNREQKINTKGLVYGV